MMKYTALRHAPVGTTPQSDGAPSQFNRHVGVILDKEFLKRDIHSLALSISRFGSSVDFFWGFVKDTAYPEEIQNMNELCDNRQSCTVRYQ
jgi:hypothetical protein